jgi:hypothetical protein
MEMSGKMLRSSRSLHSMQRSHPEGGRFGSMSSKWLTPSTLGGNAMRLNPSDAALVANPPPVLRMRASASTRGMAAAERDRNPITGEERRPAMPGGMPMSSSQTLTLPNGQPLLFPAKGYINTVGSENAAHNVSSPAARAKTERLQYELFCEAQRRAMVERELRTVQIHGRTRPPWIGDGAASGYGSLAHHHGSLYPQTR